MDTKPNSNAVETSYVIGPNETALALVVWHQFAEYFGTKFTEGHGDEPPGSWVRECAKLGADGVDRALARVLADESRQWPPTLPEFIGLAAPADRRGMTGEQRALYARVRSENDRPATTPLPGPRSPDVGQCALSELREKLRSPAQPAPERQKTAPEADIVACHRCGVGTIEGDIDRVAEYGLATYARPGKLDDVSGYVVCEACLALEKREGSEMQCEACKEFFGTKALQRRLCEKCREMGW